MTTVALGIPTVPGGADAPPRPDTPALVDQFGRVATDLRVSVTDHCNLRCTYCMPADGLDWLPKSELLDTAELIRLLRIAVVDLGVRDIRFTGGEPLLRKDIEEIIAATTEFPEPPSTSITSNGLGLVRRAKPLADAGLSRVNISLDSLDPETFTAITRRNRLSDVLDGMAAAADAGLTPVKVNSVLLRGVNDHEAPDLLQFCLDHGYQLRFIEQMPLDPQHGWSRDQMVTAEEILTVLGTRFTLSPSPRNRGSAPAERWLVDGGPADVGVIASVTRPFCGDCDRTRLTADGQMRTCLFAATETDLRTPLRDGTDDEQIAQRWRDAMWGKLAGHEINSAGFAQPIRPMSAIGG